RTEFPFLLRPSFPTEEEQLVVYKKLTEWMKGKPITFRTLDIGGDKVLSYYQRVAENNPFLGMRSLRFLLEHKDIFSMQLRAILRAGADADLGIMFPMVSSCDELQAAKELVSQNIQLLIKRGIPCHTSPAVGIMVEVPSAVEIIEDLVKEADFVSLGTNDLVQYMLAVDRTNEKVAQHYRPSHPSVIRSIKRVIDAARAKKREVSICGDMAHNEHYLPLLLGLGARTFSVASALILRTKALISRIDLSESKKLAARILGLSYIRQIEEALEVYHER
ncbi:MAG: putative PEP-binding protein, partial [Candidatus Latescibacterota bacterium]